MKLKECGVCPKFYYVNLPLIIIILYINNINRVSMEMEKYQKTGDGDAYFLFSEISISSFFPITHLRFPFNIYAWLHLKHLCLVYPTSYLCVVLHFLIFIISGGYRISLRWERQHTILPNFAQNYMKLREFGVCPKFYQVKLPLIIKVFADQSEMIALPAGQGYHIWRRLAFYQTTDTSVSKPD